MGKKMALVFCSVFFFSYLTPIVSVAGDHHDKDPKMEALKKNKIEFITKLDNLIEKYSAAIDSKKDSVKKDIRKLVDSHLAKEIDCKKTVIAKKQEKIDKLQKELAAIEADRKKYIDDKTEYFVSDEGRDKIHKKKKSFDKKKNKDSAKKDGSTPAATPK
jgi:BMFP domain-containing protein YqiC